MKRYIALLRGINISGKNKIAMPDLKANFSELGFSDVKTYLNSGNVIFSADEDDEIQLADTIAEMIKSRFSLDIPVFVIARDKLIDILNNAPDFWGTDNKDIYHNLIFVIPPATAEDIAENIGKPSKDLEQIFIYENVIFWSFDRSRYTKCLWWKKTAAPGIGELLTIRTSNTLKKAALM